MHSELGGCQHPLADRWDGYDRSLNWGNVVLILPRSGYRTWECANRSGLRVIDGWGWSLEGQPFVLPGVEQGCQVAQAVGARTQGHCVVAG
jgi:hypothetical protein